MAAAQEEDSEYEEGEEFVPEFPPELDEFLEYCVAEHGGDWEAISSDFLDIASELDDHLVDRAHEFFSPQALQERWQLLCEAGGVQEPAAQGGAARDAVDAGPGPGPESGTGAVSTEADAAPTPDAAPPGRGCDAQEVANEEAPSDFSVFSHSLKDQIDRLYSEVQHRLPSAAALEDDDSEEDVSAPGAPAAESRPEGGMSGDGTPAPAIAKPAGGKPAASSEAGPDIFEGNDLRQRAMELFGTDDLSHIFSGLGDGFPVTGDVLNFDAVLLSHGVNPHDIEGPPVEPPEALRRIQHRLDGQLGPGVAALEPPLEPAFVHAPTAAEPPAVGADGRNKAASEDVPQTEGRVGPAAPAAGAPASTKAAVAAATATDASPQGEDGEASDDSAEEDFMSMRHRLKNSSLEIMSTQESGSSDPSFSTRSLVFQPPVRRVADSLSGRAPATAAGPGRSLGQKFVALELIESSDEEEDGKAEEDSSDSDQPNEEEERDLEPLRVISRLLQKAPDGECAWDVWLEATRRWPRLQVALGSPEFLRRDGDLRVSFGAQRLRTLFDEQQKARSEKQQMRAQAAERMKNGVDEFIREAEHRRALMGSRLSGGFLLSPTGPRFEEQHEHGQGGDPHVKQEEETPAAVTDLGLGPQQQQQQAPQLHPVFKRPARNPELEAVIARQKHEREEAVKWGLARHCREPEAKVDAHKKQLEEVVAEVKRHRCALYDRQISHGPPLRGATPRAEAFLDGDGADGPPSERCSLYVLPWGVAKSAQNDTYVLSTGDQREAVSLLHARGALEALLLTSTQVLAVSAVPGVGDVYAAAVVLILGSVVADLLEVRLSSGRPLAQVLVGPLPRLPLATIFRQPLAFWALEAGGGNSPPCPSAVESETVCIALRSGACGIAEGVLAAIVAELQDDGIAVVGMRLAYPDDAAAMAVTSTAFRGAVRAGQAVLLLAIRGPSALGMWRSLLGPADPQLARQTDPASISARFGGQGRGEAVALVPPSSLARAHADVAWAFGGRIDAESPQLPRDPLHAIMIAAPRAFAVALSGAPAFADAGVLLSGLLLRMGRLLSLAVDGTSGVIVATAVREGGEGFVGGCDRLLSAPPADLGAETAGAGSLLGASPTCASGVHASSLLGVQANPCEVPRRLGLALQAAEPEAAAALEEACRLGEPEVLVVGVRPQGRLTAPLLRSVCDGLFAKFGTQGAPGLAVGSSVDLLAVRILDFTAAAMPEAQVLGGFQSFAQAARRAGADAQDEWWQGKEADGPTTLLCFRGEGIIGCFRTFLVKEWKLPGATAGVIRFSPDVHVARHAYRVFFSGLGKRAFEPTVPCRDMRSMQRFQMVPEPDLELAETSLFPRRLSPELTAAVLLPPSVDAVLFRALTAVEQQGFRLIAVAIAGRLSESMAEVLFNQEVADGQLQASDRAAFRTSAGCVGGEDEDEGHFRCIWLILSRHKSVKRFAQLCGHGDPAVNRQHSQAALRSGRDRVQNGIRCATSCASAQEMLGVLQQDLSPILAPLGVPSERRLGVEACARALECTLVGIVVVQPADTSASHLLREFHTALSERGLALVGLRALAGAPGAPESPQPEAAWPFSVPGHAELLRQWHSVQPAAARLVNLAMAGCPLILAACEGPLGAERARVAVGAVAGAAPKGCLEYYASASSAEGAADVAHLFHELFGGKHYVVDSGS